MVHNNTQISIQKGIKIEINSPANQHHFEQKITKTKTRLMIEAINFHALL